MRCQKSSQEDSTLNVCRAEDAGPGGILAAVPVSGILMGLTGLATVADRDIALRPNLIRNCRKYDSSFTDSFRRNTQESHDIATDAHRRTMSPATFVARLPEDCHAEPIQMISQRDIHHRVRRCPVDAATNARHPERSGHDDFSHKKIRRRSGGTT